jgi:hypothetical protein
LKTFHAAKMSNFLLEERVKYPVSLVLWSWLFGIEVVYVPTYTHTHALHMVIVVLQIRYDRTYDAFLFLFRNRPVTSKHLPNRERLWPEISLR